MLHKSLEEIILDRCQYQRKQECVVDIRGGIFHKSRLLVRLFVPARGCFPRMISIPVQLTAIQCPSDWCVFFHRGLDSCGGTLRINSDPRKRSQHSFESGFRALHIRYLSVVLNIAICYCDLF